ncbi:hypothetical protein [Photobacterium sp. GSS17]|nr:hypothetical protein [Photobacterium sp. GSS17]
MAKAELGEAGFVHSGYAAISAGRALAGNAVLVGGAPFSPAFWA